MKIKRNCNHERQQKFPHIFSTLLFLGLLAGAFTPSLVAQGASSDQGVVIASLLNLRKGPGLNEEVIQILENGQKLTILETSTDELWLKVRLPDEKEGWVFAIYVQFGDTEPINGVNLVDNLNLLVGPGTSYAVLATLTKGQPVTVLGRSVSRDWLVVLTADDQEGWVFRPFIETESDVASLPVSEAYGGPNGSTSPNAPLNLVVTIRDNKAVVEVNGFPKNMVVLAKLSNGSQNTSLEVASGSTDNRGQAGLSFAMPKDWPTGTSSLKVSTKDGKFSRTATIVYDKCSFHPHPTPAAQEPRRGFPFINGVLDPLTPSAPLESCAQYRCAPFAGARPAPGGCCPRRTKAAEPWRRRQSS